MGSPGGWFARQTTLMKLVSWNVQGLNKAYKQKEMQRYIKEHNISIMAIIEHRVQEKYSHKLFKK